MCRSDKAAVPAARARALALTRGASLPRARLHAGERPSKGSKSNTAQPAWAPTAAAGLVEGIDEVCRSCAHREHCLSCFRASVATGKPRSTDAERTDTPHHATQEPARESCMEAFVDALRITSLY